MAETERATESYEQPDLDESQIQGLLSTLRGRLTVPGDPDYDVARRVYNAMIDKHPRLIARCVNAADVIYCVNFARENNLLLAIRGGGHSVAGFGTCDGGLVVDLSGMRGTRVDPVNLRVRADGGCTWGDVDHATHAFGLATPGGVVSTTGIGGLTLGGGVGHLTRKYGLSCDNLLSADVVASDGRLLRASPDENEDLFWALRGGGGNFGVVTSCEYKLHPVDMVLGGPIFYSIDQAADVLRFYRAYMADAPAEVGCLLNFVLGPPAPFIPTHLHGLPVCALICCYCGDQGKAEEIVRPIRQFGPPLLDLISPTPYPALQQILDLLLPPGLQNYWKADFLYDISDQSIEVHQKYGPQVPAIQSGVHIFPMDGAPQLVGRDETAFSHRDVKFNCIIDGVWEDPADTPRNVAWVKDYWSALHPHSAGAAYVNFMMEEGQDRITSSYRDNYSRLTAIKAKYDPDNLFRVNQNIKPAKGYPLNQYR